MILFPASIALAEETTEDVDSDFYYFYGLEDYINVQVEVASMFNEEDLVVGSTVSKGNSSMWKRMGARRLTDALEMQTAVITYPATFGFYITAIRGYSRSGISTKGVVTLVDGIPVIELTNGTNDGMPNFGLGSLNDIEIIKGPGSAIYGSDAFHGVIALNTYESDKDEYSAELAAAFPLYADGSFRVSHGLSEYIRINASGSYNTQIASEDLEYKYDTPAKAAGEPYEGAYAQPAAKGTGEYKNKYKTATGVLKFDIDPSEKLNVELAGYVVNNKTDDFPGTKEVQFIQLNEWDHSWQDSTICIFRAASTYTFDNKVSVEARGYYWRWDMVLSVNNSFIGTYADFPVEEMRCGIDVIVKQQDNAFNLQWLVAYSRTYAEITEALVKTYMPDGTPYNFNTPDGLRPEMTLPHEGMNRTIDGTYGQAKWGIIKNRLFLLLGGRVDHYSDYGNQFSPRGGLIFLPGENSSIKALYGRAFQAPYGNAVHGLLAYVSGNPDVEPEIIDIYELAYIYRGREWKLNLNGFYSYWRNGIITEPYPEGLEELNVPDRYSNSGKNMAYGGEFNLFCKWDPFALESGFSYVRSIALDLETADAPPRDYDYEAFPSYIIIAGLHYRLSPWDLNFYFKNRIYLDMMESSETGDNDHLPAYWRADLNISKKILEKLDLYLDIRNITNRKNYLPSLFYSTRSEESGMLEPGISVLLRVSYNW